MTEISGVKGVGDWFINQNKKLNELDRIASEYGVSFLQYDILLRIGQRDCTSPTEIAELMQLSKTSVSRTLKSLQQKRLIERKHINEDQRKVFIKTTSDADQLVEKVNENLMKLSFIS